jgi:hypothetical protein
VQYVLVDGAYSGATNTGGNFFERGAPLLCLGEMLHELEDFLLASGEVGVYHFSTIEKKSKTVNFFRFFWRKKLRGNYPFDLDEGRKMGNYRFDAGG